MAILLRIVGAIWVLISLRPLFRIIQRLFHFGLHNGYNIMDLLHISAFVGAIGLLFLKWWGRWLLLGTLIAFFIIRIFPYLHSLSFSQFLLRQFVFYAIFIVILLIPQGRAGIK